jgi:hypothetical protein
MRLPPAREPEHAPRIDARLVQPETREQIVRGRRMVAMPANPPHGDRHFRLDYILGAHVQEGYVGSTDLLTRAARGSDFATDTCIRRQGIDPTTDSRYLEELAFEVVNEQSLRDITEQAEELIARGVRRVIALFVKKGEVREWSTREGAWLSLDPQGTLSDSTLARPIRVRELLDAAEADNAVARALLAKENPVLAEVKAESRDAGRKEGLLAGIEVACELLGIALGAEQRARMGALDASELEALLAQIRAERRVP